MMELPGGAFEDPYEQALSPGVSKPVRWDPGIAALRAARRGRRVGRATHHWSAAKQFWWKGRRWRGSAAHTTAVPSPEILAELKTIALVD